MTVSRLDLIKPGTILSFGEKTCVGWIFVCCLDWPSLWSLAASNETAYFLFGFTRLQKMAFFLCPSIICVIYVCVVCVCVCFNTVTFSAPIPPIHTPLSPPPISWTQLAGDVFFLFVFQYGKLILHQSMRICNLKYTPPANGSRLFTWSLCVTKVIQLVSLSVVIWFFTAFGSTSKK